jgi:hypothetical protein
MIKVLNSVSLGEFIEQSQWEELITRIDPPMVKNEEATSSWFSSSNDTISGFSSRPHSFLGVLSLQSGHRHYDNDGSRPPMPLTTRNKEKLQALGFSISEDGYWAIWREKQQREL